MKRRVKLGNQGIAILRNYLVRGYRVNLLLRGVRSKSWEPSFRILYWIFFAFKKLFFLELFLNESLFINFVKSNPNFFPHAF